MPVIKVETQRKPSRDGGVVRHAEKCRPELTGKIQKKIHNHARTFPVAAPRRLIGQQNARTAQHGAGCGYALLFPA